jgi:Xaa-Pro aminopeptidase
MITKEEFAQRRRRIIEAIGPESIAIVPAASETIRNGDVVYLYRQNSDFYYLTGFKEPEAVAVLAPGRKEGEYILFNRERDPKAEIWVGARAGQNAREEYGADQVFPIRMIDEKMLELFASCRQVYYPIGRNSAFDQQVMSWVNYIRSHVRAGSRAPSEFINIETILYEMRLKKSSAEIELMRKAGQASAAAHRRAMQKCRPGMMEYQLQAELLYEFSRQDCYPPAYSCIVAGGANACVLHYVDNDSKLNSNELVLVDAGGEYQYYAADITRTFPINGKFSEEQRKVYEVVLRAQKAVLEKVKPGTVWNQLQKTAIASITEGLIQLGIIKGNLSQLIENRAYDPFFMHGIGHWLGLDVHDAGSYRANGNWRSLEPGIVFTVEPGIYIRPDEKVDKKWWNIGIRIEDDVLVTADGHEVLTRDVPKEVAEIEALMAM